MSGRADNPFTARAVVIGVVVAVAGFLLFLVASAYAPDFAPSKRGGANALSKSAVGYAGLIRLLEDTGKDVRTLRLGDDRSTPDLMVVTPTPDMDEDALDELLIERDGHPTLLVLPFEMIEPLPRHRGWVQRTGTTDIDLDLDPGAVGPNARVRIIRPGQPSSLEGDGVYPMLRNKQGAVILGEVRGEDLYILTDPRRLSNQGVATLPGAQSALSLLDEVRYDDETGTTFDLTLAGFSEGPSLLKLMFEPPFVGLTLCLLAAALLAGWSGAVRFGQPTADARAVPLGKRSLIDNTAALLRLAGRTHATGALYADTVRGQLTRSGGRGPLRLDEQRSERLDELTHAVATADTEAQLLHAARALNEFKQGVTT